VASHQAERSDPFEVINIVKHTDPDLRVLRRARTAALVLVWLLACGSALAASGDLLDAIEFYNAGLDHYFVTIDANEIHLLDTGGFVGWKRTALSFKVLDPTTATANVSPVCRFYGVPAAGLDSHFYSASPLECDQVRQRYPGVWLLESNNVFLVGLPDANGRCASGTVPIYRSWNGRVDSNHRYTTDPAVQQSMIARGYIAEGYGPPSMPVVMCSPGTAAGPPSCNLVASDPGPFVGASITLTAFCDNNPTSYTWTGCTSTGSTCVATQSFSGSRVYSVLAANASGPGVPASVNVFWTDLPPPPVCNLSVTTNSATPAVGSLAMLTASCGGNPTAYQWSGCTSNSSTCLVRGTVPIPQTYTVTPINSGGAGAPVSATVNWQSSSSTPPGFCGQLPILYSDIPWGFVNVFSSAYTDLPAFAWNGVWVVKFTVAPNAPMGRTGSLNVSEYQGPSTGREATLSTEACDFRPSDYTGVNGPLSVSFGTTTTNAFAIGPPSMSTAGIQPGQTYYLNVRNVSGEDGTFSCPAAQRCDALVNLSP
jgi:hypothetical protein